jgi:TRAP-type C4-dicarboxylate transport system substrate-binding protein
MKTRLLILGALLMTVIPSGIFAQRRSEFKIASIAPENTPWGEALKKMADEWSKATDGKIKLTIYHNGTQGNEKAVLGKVNTNALQGAVLTSFGLNEITSEVLTMSCPFLIRNNRELDLVLDGLRPELEKKIEDAGYISLAWSKAGWVKFFSKEPVFVPDQLKSQKLGTNSEEASLTQAFKTLGYTMVPIDMTQVLVSLQSGMVEAVYQSPIAVGGLQAFGIAKNMASINIAPFMGGIVFNKRAWNSIPAQYRPVLIRINKRIERDLDAQILQLEERAISEMTAHGLVINTVSPEQAKLWYADVDKAMPALEGTAFDRETLSRIEQILKNHRAGR